MLETEIFSHFLIDYACMQFSSKTKIDAYLLTAFLYLQCDDNPTETTSDTFSKTILTEVPPISNLVLVSSIYLALYLTVICIESSVILYKGI